MWRVFILLIQQSLRHGLLDLYGRTPTQEYDFRPIKISRTIVKYTCAYQRQPVSSGILPNRIYLSVSGRNYKAMKEMQSRERHSSLPLSPSYNSTLSFRNNGERKDSHWIGRMYFLGCHLHVSGICCSDAYRDYRALSGMHG